MNRNRDNGSPCLTPLDGIENFLQLILIVFSLEDNVILMTPDTREEVKQVFRELDPDRAMGPVGFNGEFYCKFWDIITDDAFSG